MTLDLSKAPASPRAEWELSVKMQRDHTAAVWRALEAEFAKTRTLLARTRELLAHQEHGNTRGTNRSAFYP